jgi:DNA-binding transcriptional LysR family regulator
MALDWDDLRLFLPVARLGGLSAAAAATGASPATLGRRMTALETRVGAALFVRSPKGYQLTEAGESLLARAAEVEAAMVALERWRADEAGRAVVRLSAGTWTSAFLATEVAALWQPDDRFGLEWLTAEARVDIGRRAADIGIRNRRPEERWLAGRLIGQVAFALYRARSVDAAAPAAHRFVGVSGDSAGTPSARWLADRYGHDVALSGNDPATVRELAAAGAGVAVLPCFIGDRDARLVRASAPIAELLSEQWLVTHHERRHERAVHTVVERIALLMRRSGPLFRGERPAEAPAAAADGAAATASAAP